MNPKFLTNRFCKKLGIRFSLLRLSVCLASSRKSNVPDLWWHLCSQVINHCHQTIGELWLLSFQRFLSQAIRIALRMPPTRLTISFNNKFFIPGGVRELLRQNVKSVPVEKLNSRFMTIPRKGLRKYVYAIDLAQRHKHICFL